MRTSGADPASRDMDPFMHDSGNIFQRDSVEMLSAALQSQLQALEGRLNEYHLQNMKAVQMSMESRLFDVLGSILERFAEVDFQMETLLNHMHTAERNPSARANRNKPTEPTKSYANYPSQLRVKLLDPSALASLESTAHSSIGSSGDETGTDTHSHRSLASTLTSTPSRLHRKQRRPQPLSAPAVHEPPVHSMPSGVLTRRWGKLVVADRRSTSSLTSPADRASATAASSPACRPTALAGAGSCDVVLYDDEARRPLRFCTDLSANRSPADAGI